MPSASRDDSQERLLPAAGEPCPAGRQDPGPHGVADCGRLKGNPRIAAHLAVCGPCGENFDGLLTAIRGAG